MASIYIHIPFAEPVRKIPGIYREENPGLHTTYVQAVVAEMRHYGSLYGKEEAVETLHLGGGMPSLLSVDDLERMLHSLFSSFDGALHEATIEVEPRHVTRDYLDSLHALGFTRVSLAVQSFYQEDLDRLQMPHDAETASSAVELCLASDIEHLSVDFAVGLPEQPHEYWMANLSRAARLDIGHITFDEVAGHERSEVLADQLIEGAQFLKEHGYDHYEISNFAREGARSRQNEAYWSLKNYLGFGTSAHSLWWRGLPAHRWENVTPSSRYQALIQQGHAPHSGRQALSLDDLADEFLMLQLRTGDGVDLTILDERFGLDLLDFAFDTVSSLQNEGYLLPVENDRLRLSEKGFLVCDALTKRLLSAITIE